jgi:hypothetical protein
MPLWTQPLLRARQNALENEGLIQKRDSTGVTILKNKESQGLVAKPSLPGVQVNLRGTKHDANTEL